MFNGRWMIYIAEGRVGVLEISERIGSLNLKAFKTKFEVKL